MSNCFWDSAYNANFMNKKKVQDSLIVIVLLNVFIIVLAPAGANSTKQQQDSQPIPSYIYKNMWSQRKGVYGSSFI